MSSEQQGQHTYETLREYFNRVLDERDDRYQERFKAIEKASEIALVAIDKQTGAAFRASEIAINKAEEAQQLRNVAQNEFRGQLSDQASTFIARKEAEALISGVSQKEEAAIISLRNEMLAKFEALDTRQRDEKARGDVAQGRVQGVSDSTARTLSYIGIGIAVVGVLLKFLVT